MQHKKTEGNKSKPDQEMDQALPPFSRLQRV